MVRFNPNRSWAFVLTLCLFTTCLFVFTAQLPSVARADLGGSLLAEDQPPPTWLGDPDVPMGPGDDLTDGVTIVRSVTYQAVSQSGARPARDGAVPISVAMDRLRLFLLSLRSLFLGF